jgi:hypothetical protein
VGTSDEVPYRPSWLMPDALEGLIREFDDSARLSIRSNWQALSFKQRERLWHELTDPRLRRTRLKRALLIAEILLDAQGSAGIPGQSDPLD